MDNEYKKYFLKILKKYNQGTATKEEVEFLESYYDTFEAQDDLINSENEAEFQGLKLSIKKVADERIDDHIKKNGTKLRLRWIGYAAAAIVLVSFSVALYLTIGHSDKKVPNNQAALILPGGNKAVLTLSNGTKILLDDAQKGEVAKQSNMSITKTANNQIVYVANANVRGNQPAYQLENTITTPNGGQYQLVLPDGTKVMLNAASSLTYPASFHGNERVVQLDGEAYFEVAKNKMMPFRVKSGNQTVEVLGTHFNINAYKDEANIKTTLLEGSVKVSSGTKYALIVPGQQAVAPRNGTGDILKYTVDVEKETAWKNGFFSFQNDDLRSVMRQVARWYDVSVVYADNLPHEKFTGEISRNSNLSDVFKILELNDVRFGVEGKTVTVSAK